MPATTTTTFLILILAQAHFAHAAIAFKRASPNRRRRAAPTVTFHAPKASSTYAPGTSIHVSWTSDTEVVSPSFRLCVVGPSIARKRHSDKAEDDEKDSDDKETDNDEKDDSSGNDKLDDGGDGSCGAAVWATVKNDGDEYSIEVTAPAVNAPTRFYLEMRDDFDDGMRTNIFTIEDGDSAATQDVGGQAPMQAGDSGSSTASSPSTSTNGLPSNGKADSFTGASSSNAGHSSTGNAGGSSSNTNSSSSNASPLSSPQTGASGGSPNAGAPNSAPNYPPYLFPSTPALLATRSPPPVAAFAVPLSIVGAILLIAAVALFRRRKDDRIKGEGLQNVGIHQNDAEKGGVYPFSMGGMPGLPMSGALGMGGGMYSGIPASGMGVMPVPLYMPREVTRDAGYYGSPPTRHRFKRDESYRPYSRDTHRSRSRDEYHSRSRSTRSHTSSVTGDVLFDYLDTRSGDRVCTPPSAHIRRSAQTRMDTKEVFGRVGEKLKGAGGGGVRYE